MLKQRRMNQKPSTKQEYVELLNKIGRALQVMSQEDEDTYCPFCNSDISHLPQNKRKEHLQDCATWDHVAGEVQDELIAEYGGKNEL